MLSYRIPYMNPLISPKLKSPAGGSAQERSQAHPFELNPLPRRNPETFVPGTCRVATDQWFGSAHWPTQLSLFFPYSFMLHMTWHIDESHHIMIILIPCDTTGSGGWWAWYFSPTSPVTSEQAHGPHGPRWKWPQWSLVWPRAFRWVVAQASAVTAFLSRE